jgi:hypothetical protein
MGLVEHGPAMGSAGHELGIAWHGEYPGMS